jgi:DNA modification methylase
MMDPFAGSGTVGMVAKQFHRSSISIEINPRYCDMIKKRTGFDDGRKEKYLYTKVQ